MENQEELIQPLKIELMRVVQEPQKESDKPVRLHMHDPHTTEAEGIQSSQKVKQTKDARMQAEVSFDEYPC